MSGVTTRRSTRRTAASVEPAQPALERVQPHVPAPEVVSKKRGRKPKAATAASPVQAESQTVTESRAVTKVTATSRANAAVATTTATSSSFTTTTTQQPAPAPSRRTRAGRANAEAVGAASPQRSLEQIKAPKRQRKQKNPSETAEAVPEPAAAHDEDDDEQGRFFSKKFDSDLMHADTSPAQPVFVNGSESALALLHKIENAAKQSTRADPSMNDSETVSDHDVTAERSPQQPPKRSHAEASATPEHPAPTPSIFSRSFSALKSRFFSSTPKAPATQQVATPTPPKPLPPPDTFTETLSLPPTPVGERVKTPGKRKQPVNIMMKLLLRGIDHGDKRKAEAWAKQVIPEFRNDPDFREKRRRLESNVLFKDLNHFPSSKPWENGFGDPLGDLDDDDIVPGWAIYMDIMAEEEEHKTKKYKKSHGTAADDEEVPTIDEQYAASNSIRSSPKLYNSHGQSASLYDFHPRRSIEPSPMFATPVSHHDGDNIFNELQKHDTAVEVRTSDREVSLNTQPKRQESRESSHQHNPNMGSFSVPDESDDDDSILDNETPEAESAPVWTQPPPPAPVPAHAPLPGTSAVDVPTTESVAEVATDLSTSTTQQPKDEIERQRQRLMKHTPAKPSRLREATYPSPSLLSDAGNESILAATPIPLKPSMPSMFADMPGAEIIELDDECQAAFDELVNTEEYKQQVAATHWPAPTLTYESDEEDLSPTSTV